MAKFFTVALAALIFIIGIIPFIIGGILKAIKQAFISGSETMEAFIEEL